MFPIGVSALPACPVAAPRQKDPRKVGVLFPALLSRSAIQWVRARGKGGAHGTKIAWRGWRGVAFLKGVCDVTLRPRESEVRAPDSHKITTAWQQGHRYSFTVIETTKIRELQQYYA